ATDEDPEHVADLVNGVARSYQQHRARTAREMAGRRRQIIATQLAALSDSLRVAQQAAIDYQSRNVFSPNAEAASVTGELVAVDGRRRELSYQESILSGLVAGLQTSGRNDQALQMIMALGADLVPQGPELSRRIQELQLRRAELTASRFGLTAEDPQVQVVDSLISETRGQARLAAEQALMRLQGRISQENARYSQLAGRAGALPVQTAEFGRLQLRVNAIQAIFDQHVGRYFEAQIAEGVEVGDIDIVAAAATPVWPDPSYRTLNLTIGLIAGMLVGIVGALLTDQVDSRVRRKLDAERATSLEVIGTIPEIRSLEGRSATALIGKDAFRTLRTHLRFARAGRPPQLIAVTSATPRDGKSTVAANLALTLADQGARTLLVDADLRRPQIHTTFSLEQAPGLSDVLRGSVPLEAAAVPSAEGSTLRVLPCGSGVDNPTEFIGDPGFEALLVALRDAYDYVVIDTPPLLAVTDAALVGAVADGTLVVVRANRTDLNALRTAVQQLRRLRVPLLGMVLNAVPKGHMSDYAYYPSHYPSYAKQVPEEEAQQKRPLLHGGRTHKAS
ncbi:MAG: polysaccharide biosynthesis tyrosine autokinase, partial [Gemmatimonadota bacterium]